MLERSRLSEKVDDLRALSGLFSPKPSNFKSRSVHQPAAIHPLLSQKVFEASFVRSTENLRSNSGSFVKAIVSTTPSRI